MACIRLSALFALFLLLATACVRADPPYEPGPRPVKTVVVGEPRQTVTRAFSGMARASADTALSFRIPGVLQSLPAQVGRQVRAGELIARLDPTDYRLKVLELESQVVQAEAVFTKAEADYERIRPLFEDGIVSKSTLDDAQAARDASRAALEAVRKNLELAGQQLTYTTLTAPVNGTVSAVPVENFQTVQAGQPIAVLSSDEIMEFEAGLPDHLIHSIALNDRAEVLFDVLPGRAFPARVVETGITPGAVSTYPVKLRLEESSPRIRPGMIGEARFEITPDNGEPYMTVPVEAVFGLPDGTQAVWIVDERTSTVQRRAVNVGRLVAEGLQVLGGLTPGDHLVVRGVHRLEEGQRVRLMDKAAEATPTISHP